MKKLSTRTKTPITYYGGKQQMTNLILPKIPLHKTYVEAFFGGGAIFFAKEKSYHEVINDTNKEVINFYRVVQNDYTSLEKEIKITLHSRDLHKKASVIYNNPDMFSELKRAWAFWVLSSQSFCSIIDGSWGYDKNDNKTSLKISNKRESFTENYSIRLQQVEIECTDALRVITSRDTKETFFYLDPPYYNSDMGHYDGYTIDDFESLLKACAKIEGKFLLSSYPSDILNDYINKYKWKSEQFKATVSVGYSPNGKPKKSKIEVLTCNY